MAKKPTYEELEQWVKALEKEAVNRKQDEERYKALFENSLDCIFLHDFEGNFIDINPAALNLLGYDKEEIPTLNMFKLTDKEGLKKTTEDLKVILKEGSLIKPSEYRVKKKDGKFVYIEAKSSLVFRDGQPVGVMGTARDITDHKRAEEALRESEERLRSVYNTAPLAFVIWDKNTHIKGWNKKAEEVLGWSKEEVVGYSFFDFIIPEKDRPQVEDVVKNLMKGELLSRSINDNLTKEGEAITCEWNNSILHDNYGNIIGAISIGLDITDRIKAEKAIRESEKKYKDLAELLPQFVYELDDKGFFTFVNIAGIAMSGYAQEDFDNGLSGLEVMHGESTERIAQDIIRVLKGERLTDRNYMLKRKDETVIPITTYSIPIEQDNKIVGIRGVGVDISKHIAAEDALRNTILGTIQAMAHTVEIRDPYTSGHQQRVASLATAIAEDMGFSEEQVEGVLMAAMIHDIGKISVPAEILSKPGIISEIEFNMIKTHAKMGYEILERIEFPWPIAKIVLQHHERINGSGYPSGLSDEDILIEAKIVGVADVVESMVSHRPYRPGLGIEKGLEEILENRGILYSPEVVDACLKLFRENNFSFDEIKG